ncbi:TonB-dependent receptor [Woodsholea maritima]|uniref:TonB-dependent receptor n=1 Tax=Woodsholea maritima TaxID=240237 RepID=UPI0003772539|nr:TonB-dependent receptor [Woodsholea maritima]
MPFFKSGLLAGAAIIALAGVAQAQETARLETIVVTAQKREQDQREVPFSIATLSGEQYDTIFAAGGDIIELGARIPSVYAETSNGRYAPRFYIRGFGNVDFDFTASQPVSVVQDEVVLESVYLKGFPMFDVKQIEVLRGPQGTLFGRNTPAGVIKIDTVKPGDAFEANFTAAYGSFDTARVEGGVTYPVMDNLSVRVAGLVNSRNDWIDNANQNTNFASNEGDDLGGYKDVAVRAHIAWEPIEGLSTLTTLQYRELDGTSTLFRANILNKGSNKLNDRFDRDTVFFDGGRNHFQYQETYSASFRADYDLGFADLTSITAYYEGDSAGNGDIDGGLVGNTSQTGFVPFPSESGTLDSDLQQYTQEIRLSNHEGRLGWQVGAFFFKEDIRLISASFNGFGAPAPTIVTDLKQTSTAWAIFGQGEYAVNDQLTITAGLRYTDDDRDFAGYRTFPATRLLAVSDEASDEQISWDLSALYAYNDDVNLYARVARGYRGPSIQGRINFADTVTKADSETVTSFEVGMKSELMDDRLQFNAAAFRYIVKDQQFTAIGGDGNFNRLINADEGLGYGVELETIYAVTDNFTLTGGFSWNKTEIRDDNLRVAYCGGGCTVTDPTVVVGGKSVAEINGNPFPQAPDIIANITARYAIPAGNGEFYALGDWNYQGRTNFFLYESKEFNSKGNHEGGLRLGYVKDDGSWDFSVFARNITNEKNLLGAIDFNNLTGFVNEPRTLGVELKARFN